MGESMHVKQKPGIWCVIPFGLVRLPSLGVILTVAALLRVASIVILRNFMHPQLWEFGALAKAISAGKGFSDLTKDGSYQPSIYMPPGYPFVLASFYKILGERPLTFLLIEITQAASGVLLVYIVYRLANILLGKRGAIAAACIVAIYPAQIYMCNEIHGISLYIVLGTGAAFFLTRFLEVSHSWADVLAAGLCMGILMLFRGEAPGLLLLYAIILIMRGGWGVVVKAAVFVLIAISCLAPWTIRNYREFGKLIPICSSAGVNLWIGNNPAATGDDRYVDADLVREALSNYPMRAGDRQSSELSSVPFDVKEAFDRIPMNRYSFVAKDAALKTIATTYARSHPLREAELAAKKFTIFFLYDSSHEKGREPIYWVPSVLLSIMAAWGAFVRGKRLLTSDLYLVSSVFFAVVVGMAVFVLPRYKMVIDPFLIIFAAAVFRSRGELANGTRNS